MFIGHFAVGLALKRMAPKTNLGWLIAAVAFVDALWPFFLLVGLERVEIDPGNTAFTPLNFVHYPFTHSLIAGIAWAILFGFGIYFAIDKYWPGAIAVAIGVISHWFLDFFVHRPDLPLYPGSEKYGLAIWNSVPLTLAVESAMLALGVWIYLKTTTARDRTGTYVFWIFIAMLVLSYVGTALGPPPPSPTTLIFFAPVVWIYIGLATWADRHRQARVRS